MGCQFLKDPDWIQRRIIGVLLFSFENVQVLDDSAKVGSPWSGANTKPFGPNRYFWVSEFIIV